MEIIYVLASALLILLPSLIFLGVKVKLQKRSGRPNLPLGRLGWPVLGESIEYLRANWDGHLDKFITDRVERYGSTVFKTSLFGHRMVFVCGPAGNKLLFSNEGKKLAVWRPGQLHRLIGPSLLCMADHEAWARRKLMMAGFFNAESLKKFVPTIDDLTRSYMETHWLGKEEVRIYSSIKLYTFELACRAFMSITEPELVSRLFDQFLIFLKGTVQIPLDIPGTPFHRAMGASGSIKSDLRTLLRQRRAELVKAKGRESPIICDIMSYFLVTADENGKSISETEIVNDMLTLLFSSFDTLTSAISLLVKYLGKHPAVNEAVFQEQREIAESKAPGEPLQWEDLQGMKYTGNVISEVLRIAPPALGFIREASVDINFEGYTIPKGWKLFGTTAYTHKDPSCYPNAMEFDESRFEGTGPPPFSYVPFGGGPRMCIGKEFARFEILVFLHNLVNRFDWDLLDPNEKWSYEPSLCPANGLPIRLHRRKFPA